MRVPALLTATACLLTTAALAGPVSGHFAGPFIDAFVQPFDGATSHAWGHAATRKDIASGRADFAPVAAARAGPMFLFLGVGEVGPELLKLHEDASQASIQPFVEGASYHGLAVQDGAVALAGKTAVVDPVTRQEVVSAIVGVYDLATGGETLLATLAPPGLANARALGVTFDADGDLWAVGYGFDADRVARGFLAFVQGGSVASWTVLDLADLRLSAVQERDGVAYAAGHTLNPETREATAAFVRLGSSASVVSLDLDGLVPVALALDGGLGFAAHNRPLAAERESSYGKGTPSPGLDDSRRTGADAAVVGVLDLDTLDLRWKRIVASYNSPVLPQGLLPTLAGWRVVGSAPTGLAMVSYDHDGALLASKVMGHEGLGGLAIDEVSAGEVAIATLGPNGPGIWVGVDPPVDQGAAIQALRDV